jgi:hypothetical protein
MTIKELMHKAEHKKLSTEVWREIYSEMEEFIEEVKHSHPAKVKELEEELEELICFTPLSMEEACHWVKHLKNNDGTQGGHWSEEEVRKAVSANPILSKFHFPDVYAAMNMVWSDNWESGYGDIQAVKDTVHFLGDKDAPKNKMYRYIKAMAD